ncbi:MAG: alpha/beta fold hydrolase [Pseudomonadota bacterium]
MPVPVVLVHGWSLAPEALAPLRSGLSRAPALPGHAGAADWQGWDVDALARRWLKMVVSESKAAGTPAPAIWIGASLGAQVALAAAMLAPERVRGLVLLGATPCFVARDDWPQGMPQQQFEAFRLGCHQAPARTLARFDALQLHGDQAASTGRQALRAMRAGAPGPTREGLEAGLQVLAETDLRSRLETVQCPTLWLTGAGDAITPPASAEAAALRQRSARVCSVPGAGHAAYLTQPRTVTTLLRQWYQDHFS